jgi:anti-anti-sigma factor
MAIDRSRPHNRNAKAPRTRSTDPQAEQSPERIICEVERSGDWMPAEELRAVALGALEAGNDITLNLDRVDHLDASALQILLALSAEQKKRGRDFQLVNASPNLLQWFGFAGAADNFFDDGATER